MLNSIKNWESKIYLLLYIEGQGSFNSEGPAFQLMEFTLGMGTSMGGMPSVGVFLRDPSPFLRDRLDISEYAGSTYDVIV